MASTTQLYSIRPARRRDVFPASRVYCASFANDTLADLLFPARHEHPRDFRAAIARIFQYRWWNPTYSLTVMVSNKDGSDEPVGFAMWRRPESDISFYERWLSPTTWLCSFMSRILEFKSYLFPIKTMYMQSATAYEDALAKVKKDILNTDRRRQALYLSILGVHPSLQGLGLGSMLVRDGLRHADRAQKATWLVGVSGVDKFYNRLGYVEVARANVAELDGWDGGSVMFRE